MTDQQPSATTVPPTAAHSPTTNRTIVVVGVVIIILGVISLVLLVGQQSAVHALKTSSGRGECRSQVKNDADDLAQHRQAQLTLDTLNLIKQANAGQIEEALATLEQARTLAQKIVDTPTVQSVIDATCPKPLVQVPPPSSRTSTATTTTAPDR